MPRWQSGTSSGRSHDRLSWSRLLAAIVWWALLGAVCASAVAWFGAWYHPRVKVAGYSFRTRGHTVANFTRSLWADLWFADVANAEGEYHGWPHDFVDRLQRGTASG